MVPGIYKLRALLAPLNRCKAHAAGKSPEIYEYKARNKSVSKRPPKKALDVKAILDRPPRLSLDELCTQNAIPRCKGKMRKPQSGRFRLISADAVRAKPAAQLRSEACEAWQSRCGKSYDFKARIF
jgi:hypothetical protein